MPASSSSNGLSRAGSRHAAAPATTSIATTRAIPPTRGTGRTWYFCTPVMSLSAVYLACKCPYRSVSSVMAADTRKAMDT